MPSNDYDAYELPVRGDANRRNVTAWLTLGLISLVAAGIFSILLVLARTPVVQGLIPFLDFFKIALVVHVTLSVLVWLLAMSAASWSLSTTRDQPLWDSLSFSAAALGTAIIIVCPFVGAGDPLMNNYVPILRHPLFYGGLTLFAVGIMSHLVRAIIYRPRIRDVLTGSTALQAGITISTLLTGFSILAVVASWLGLPNEMEGRIYFEFLFWGGGHVIQFSYTLLMMIAWVVLATASGCRFELTPRLTLVFLVFLALPVITVPFLYLAHDITTAGHRLAFTELMKYGGLSCLPLGLAVAASLWRAEKPVGERRYLRAALISSLGLFAVGGILSVIAVARVQEIAPVGKAFFLSIIVTSSLVGLLVDDLVRSRIGPELVKSQLGVARALIDRDARIGRQVLVVEAR